MQTGQASLYVVILYEVFIAPSSEKSPGNSPLKSGVDVLACIYALDDAKLYTCSLAEERAWLVVEDVDHLSCCPAMVAQFHLDSTG